VSRLDEFVADLEQVGDRAERIDALIGIAKRYQAPPAEVATPPYDETHKVPACESQAYVWGVPQADGTLRFHFAVLNPQGVSAMALAVILDETLSGAPLAEVRAVPSDVVYRIFGHELSMGKSMGLMGMVTMVRGLAERSGAPATR
jgi:cysteine desulfuration protein SufE